MAKAKIAVTLDDRVLDRLDRFVRGGLYPNRSQAIEAAVVEKLARLEHRRLAAECAKLDPHAERTLAEEGCGGEVLAWHAISQNAPRLGKCNVTRYVSW
ncbi:MAG TPA: ribbon-helix-helix domain-containing protein [Gemmatimonadales bacterium]